MQSRGVFTFPRRGAGGSLSKGLNKFRLGLGGGLLRGPGAGGGGGPGQGQRSPLGCFLVGTEGSMCLELLKASCRVGWAKLTQAVGGTLVCSDGPLCTRGQLVQFPSQLEQRWLRRWGRQQGHRLQSPVPVLLANEWLGLEVPTLVLRRPPPQLCLPPRLNHSLALPKGW